MKTIIITGSSRGIGFGLAQSFLARGCRVVVSGSTAESTAQAVQRLARYPETQLLGHPCAVTDLAQQQALWDAAQRHFGTIDVWINNAGVAHPYQPVWELDPMHYRHVMEVNLLGVLNGSRVAIQQFLKQGSGQLYNMEGFGSNGRVGKNISVYGSSKAAVTFLTRSLIVELQGTAVQVGTLSPGIVTTDLLSDQYRTDPEGFKSAKRIFNILGDKPTTVTPWLAEQVLRNTRHGARIEWLTTPKVLWRFLSAPFSKRDLYAK